jgi:hypothetical protein
MITTHVEDMEPSLYTESKVLWRFTESDIASGDKILNVCNNSLIMADNRYNVYLGSVPSTNEIELNNPENNIVANGGGYRGKIEIIREEYLNKYYSITKKKEGLRYVTCIRKVNGTDMVKERDERCNRFYDLGGIKAYQV